MDAVDTIKKYFDFFNQGNNEGMISLLHEDVAHEVNQGDTRNGLPLFKEFMKHMDTCYKENLRDITIMSSPSVKDRVSAEFIVDGTYLKTDKGLPEARNQKYSVRAGTFFELKNGKISRITTYYNLPQWIKAVQ
tara:strand:+ start:75918 stop:76319 length:402 start_codon:yes stop_codon:yes gene_type:complete